MSIVRNKKLLAIIIAVIVAFGMVIPMSAPVYADEQADTYFRMYDSNSNIVDEFYDDECVVLEYGDPDTNMLGAGGVMFHFYYDGKREELTSKNGSAVSVPQQGNLTSITLVGNKYKSEDIEGPKYVVSDGTYLARVSYYEGEGTSIKSAWSDWYEFEVLESSMRPNSPTNPNPPSNPTPNPAPSSDPVPAPIVKSTPSASIEVASGSVKANKLNAALAVPTATFSLSSAGGTYPTGNANFVLQKRSGSKWKALSSKTVGLSGGKAKYKLSKATDAGSYRLQVSYNGDSNYNAVTTSWTKIKIAKAKGVAKKSLKVYKKASKGKKLTTLKKGKKIVITGKSGKYYKVSLKVKGKTEVGYALKTSIKLKK